MLDILLNDINNELEYCKNDFITHIRLNTGNLDLQELEVLKHHCWSILNDKSLILISNEELLIDEIKDETKSETKDYLPLKPPIKTDGVMTYSLGQKELRIGTMRHAEIFLEDYKTQLQQSPEIVNLINKGFYYDLNGVIAIIEFSKYCYGLDFSIRIDISKPFYFYCMVVCELWYCKKTKSNIWGYSFSRYKVQDDYYNFLTKRTETETEPYFLKPQYRSKERQLLEILQRHYYIPTEINNGLKKTEIGDLFAYLIHKGILISNNNKRIAPLFAKFLGFTADPKDKYKRNYIGNSTIYNGSYKEMKKQALKTDIEKFMNSIF